MTRLLAVHGVACALFSCVIVAQQSPQPGQATAPPSRERAIATREALRAEGLRGVAKLNGGEYSTTFVPHSDFGVFKGMEYLAASSDVVVVGTAVSTVSKMSLGGERVFSYVTVAVTDAPKGAPAGEIIVKVEGGRFRFDDGIEVESKSSDERFGLIPGRRYALFLELITQDRTNNPLDLNSPVFRPTNASQGIFDVSNRAVVAQASPTMPIWKEANGEPTDQFLAKLPGVALTPPRR